MKILAVDDDPLLLEVLEKLLNGAGYGDVTLAAGPQEALALIESETPPFECFLLDIQMPGMDGIELCDRLRRMPEYRETPVVMVTAMHDKAYVDSAFAAGANDYVTKPFDVVDLGIRIRHVHREHLERKQLRDQEMQAPFAVDGVTGALSGGAMEDYLETMPSTERRTSCVFAVRMDDARYLHTVTTAKEFRSVVTEVADCIAAELAPQVYAFSYAGNGRFVCATHAEDLIDRDSFEAAVQHRLDGKNLTSKNGAPLDLHIAVGSPMRPRMSVSGGARALIARVLERVDHPGNRGVDLAMPTMKRASVES